MSKEIGIAFTPDKLINAKKDFAGIIVVSEYLDNPRFTGKQLHIEIQTNDYEKNQHEWYAPSDKQQTKWAHLIEALSKSGALKDVNWEGSTTDEQMNNFAKSLKGMQFRFIEYTDLPSIAKNKITGKMSIEAILPMEYMGRAEVGEVQQETIGDEGVTL